MQGSAVALKAYFTRGDAARYRRDGEQEPQPISPVHSRISSSAGGNAAAVDGNAGRAAATYANVLRISASFFRHWKVKEEGKIGLWIKCKCKEAFGGKVAECFAKFDKFDGYVCRTCQMW